MKNIRNQQQISEFVFANSGVSEKQICEWFSHASAACSDRGGIDPREIREYLDELISDNVLLLRNGKYYRRDYFKKDANENKSERMVSTMRTLPIILSMFSLLFSFGSPSRADEVPWTDEDTEQVWHWIKEKEVRWNSSTKPRNKDANEEEGEGILETFGTQYLPNAYAYYLETRATAKEREQVLNENFPNGRPTDEAGSALYDKVQKAFKTSLAEMFRRHDEICHFYLLHEFGAITDRELAKADSSQIKVILPVVIPRDEEYIIEAPGLEASDLSFAEKYMPESLAVFQRLETAFADGMKSGEEWLTHAALIDAKEPEALFQPALARLDAICKQMISISKTIKEKKLLHAVDEISSSDLAEVDHKLGLSLQKFEKELPIERWVRKGLRSGVELAKRHGNPVPFLIHDMVKIPGKNLMMGKTEVTGSQWNAVMGENPLYGSDGPCTNLTFDDCQLFLKKLNALALVKKSGMTFRLPTADEWLFACRAGGKYQKLSDGTEITKNNLDEVAWFKDNSGGFPHIVGQKKPNAFGLYDMLGNAAEWTQTKAESYYQDNRLIYGGPYYENSILWDDGPWNLERWREFKDESYGFRLCADSKAE